MTLFYRKYGKGHPLIIVHGLYGSSDNWVTIAKILSENFEVYIIDQRNHGNSPHSKEHNYTLMQNDLLEFMNFHSIESAILMGHSMGGRTVMMFSENYPERVNKIIVVDVSPVQDILTIESKQIFNEHQSIVNCMLDVDFSSAKTRVEINNQLSKNISQIRLRQFLLKNVKKEENSFLWKINIKTIKENLEKILIGFNNEFRGKLNNTPTLFIKGGNSNYIQDNHKKLISEIFSIFKIKTILDAGHWVHAEQPKEFLSVIKEFLETE